LHAVTSGLKALVYNDGLRYAQSNRLCCGGHGYSASSGLGQIIQDMDAGCTYEGDNVVLLLQTARYLLKCAQKGISPHLELSDMERIKTLPFFKQFEALFQIYYKLYDE
jgi:acyl-CoA oxidase